MDQFCLLSCAVWVKYSSWRQTGPARLCPHLMVYSYSVDTPIGSTGFLIFSYMSFITFGETNSHLTISVVMVEKCNFSWLKVHFSQQHSAFALHHARISQAPCWFPKKWKIYPKISRYFHAFPMFPCLGPTQFMVKQKLCMWNHLCFLWAIIGSQKK